MTAAVPGLEATAPFLRQPGSFPEAACRVDARETHMSWIFMLDTCVFKLKKPVHHDCPDFRSLAARRFYCEEELRLNRRLAPGVWRRAADYLERATSHIAEAGTAWRQVPCCTGTGHQGQVQ